MKKLKKKWKTALSLTAIAAVVFVFFSVSSGKKNDDIMKEEREQIAGSTAIIKITENDPAEPDPDPKTEEVDQDEGEADILPSVSDEPASTDNDHRLQQEQTPIPDETEQSLQQGEDTGEFDPPA